MKISIITVTYNSAAFIEHCMSSVIQQTYKDVEYIVIDGKSTDGTISIVKSFKDVVYISERDNGIYDAINKGIALATGDVVGILNSDDFFADNDVLSRISAEFLKDPSLDAVYSDVSFVEEPDLSKSVRHYSSKKFRPGMFRFGFQPAHPTFYARKELFKKYGMYRTDLKISGDFELLLRFLYIQKISYKYIDDLWVKMRTGGVSTSGINSVLRLNAEIIKACEINNVYTNRIMVYSKYLVKWWGFLRR